MSYKLGNIKLASCYTMSVASLIQDASPCGSGPILSSSCGAAGIWCWRLWLHLQHVPHDLHATHGGQILPTEHRCPQDIMIPSIMYSGLHVQLHSSCSLFCHHIFFAWEFFVLFFNFSCQLSARCCPLLPVAARCRPLPARCLPVACPCRVVTPPTTWNAWNAPGQLARLFLTVKAGQGQKQ